MHPPAPATPPDGPAGFQYAIIPASYRDWLRAAAETARSLAYRTACDMIRVGRLLAEARGRLKRRTFRTWVAAELPWSRAHCYRLIAVADTFGPLVAPDAAERIDPTALYLLARPEAPPEARAYAVELSAGKRVTAADAREILAAHRRTPDPAKSEVTRLAPLRPGDVARPARVTAPAAFDAAAAWAAVEELCRTCTVVHIAPIAEEADEDEPLYSVTAYREDDVPAVCVRRTLADAVLAACGREPKKHCTSCGTDKPVGEFGQVEGAADGRNRYCKRCERQRLAEFKKRKKRGP